MNREDAWGLLTEYTQSESLKKHAMAVEACMRAYARKLAPGSADADVSATRYEWGPCGDGSSVVLWKLSGSGHVWPGATRSVFFLGHGTQVVNANDQMWQFFRSFSLTSDKGE